MSENRKLKVFLCHSKDDKSKVRELYYRLVADGFDPWLDEEKLIPGQEWDLEIRKAVRESDVVVVCLSMSSTTKAGYVQKEIRFALDVADEQPEGGIYIIPARLEDCQVPSRLSKWQWVNLFEFTGYDKLILSLGIHFDTHDIDTSLFIGPEMVQIPAGNFLMGTTKEQARTVLKEVNNDKDWEKRLEWEQPQRVIFLSEYFMAKYQVTNREYQIFVHNTKYSPPHGWDGTQFPLGKGNHPVVNLSWNDAIAYCKWLSMKSGKQYRLPNEIEWEKAARGEDGRIYPWGDNFDSQKANTKETKLGDTSEVGHFSPQGNSPYGCSDMIGNVWEWCNNLFDEDEYKQRIGFLVGDLQNMQKGQYHVLRGGSFGSKPWNARCATRLRNFPNSFNHKSGFRVALIPVKLEVKDQE